MERTGQLRALEYRLLLESLPLDDGELDAAVLDLNGVTDLVVGPGGGLVVGRGCGFGLPFTGGSDSGLTRESILRPRGESSFGPMFSMIFDRSRSLPSASITPGLS